MTAGQLLERLTHLRAAALLHGGARSVAAFDKLDVLVRAWNSEGDVEAVGDLTSLDVDAGCTETDVLLLESTEADVTMLDASASTEKS